MTIRRAGMKSGRKVRRRKRRLPPRAAPPRKALKAAAARGMQLIGFTRAEMGIGESCRLAARAAETAGIPFHLLNFPLQTSARSSDLSWVHKEATTSPYRTNIFHLNADVMPLAYRHFGPRLFQGKYNIGYWHWELPVFPDDWLEHFQYVQEVWVPTNFILQSISKKSPVPVLRIPHGIVPAAAAPLPAGAYGLPGGRFLFLSMYDTFSYQERKNPQAAVDAFRRAFPEDNASVGLVLKVNCPENSKQELVRLKESIAGHPSIYLIDQVMSRQEVASLLQTTHCFVSLHRSEGFGLVLAEAMAMGKPVIGTNWSGNADFMNPLNSCTVGYELVPVGRNVGPYGAFQIWAEPDIEHAAHYMRRLVSDPVWRQCIALQGRETIMTHYSPQVTGAMMRSRLATLGLL